MTDSLPRRPARFAVVVPAHDEQAVIQRCLAFVADLEPGEAQVVVAANGCTDRTVELARAVPGVRVLDLAAASKAAALNAGDDAVTAFPRVYLDADIAVSAATLRAVVTRLAEPGVHAAAPTARFGFAGVGPGVRAFYRAYQAMPYLTESMVGTGFYALSEAGRARFGRFPDLTADDLFVQRLFAPTERAVLAGESFTVEVPRDLRSLVAVRTRVAAGNAELARRSTERVPGAGVGGAAGAMSASTAGSLRALAGWALRDPRRLPDAAVYTGVTALARARAARGPVRWERDASTRTAP